MPTELANREPQQMAAQPDQWAFLDRANVAVSQVKTQDQERPKGDELHGFYYDMPFDAYASIPALNGSQVLAMRRSPMFYKWNRDNPKEETVALKIGKLIHMLTLEPHLAGEFAVWGRLEEQKVRRGKEWDKFQAANADKIILTVAEHAEVINTATSALQNAPIRKYAYAPGRTEVSAFWRDPATGLRMKARFDKMMSDEHCIVDLKTTRSAEPYQFSRQAWKMGYVHKMAHYWNGYRTLTGHEPRMPLLAIEKTGPCEGAVYEIQRDHLLIGLDAFSALVQKIAECEQKNAWPPAVETEAFLELPPYAVSDEEDTALELEM